MRSLALLGLLVSLPALGRGGLVEVEVEPIIGYEREQKLLPEPRTTETILYGARLTAGIPMVSGELEYTTSTDTESFPALGLSQTEKTERAKLGIVSKLRLGRLFRFKLRGGAQARRTTTEQTSGTVTTRSVSPVKYKPYLGAGVQARLTPKFRFSADLVTIFEDFPSFRNNQYQLTAGFSVKFP